MDSGRRRACWALIGAGAALVATWRDRVAEARRWARDERKGAYRQFRRAADSLWRAIEHRQLWEEFEPLRSGTTDAEQLLKRVDQIRARESTQADEARQQLEETHAELALVASRSVLRKARKLVDLLLDAYDPTKRQLEFLNEQSQRIQQFITSDEQNGLDASPEPEPPTVEQFEALKAAYTQEVLADLGLAQ